MERTRNGRRNRPIEHTRLIYDVAIEELKCEKCDSVLHWNFGFKRCPYCGRKIDRVDERRARLRL